MTTWAASRGTCPSSGTATAHPAPKGATIHTFDSPGTNGDVFAVDGKHGIDTYLGNIQDAV